MVRRLFSLSGQPDDQTFSRRFDDFFGYRVEFIDLQDALHLQQQAVNQTNVACRDTDNGVDLLL